MCLVWDTLVLPLNSCCSVFSVPNVQTASALALKKGSHQVQCCNQDIPSISLICLPAVILPFSATEMHCCCKNSVGNCKVFWGCCDQTVMWQHCEYTHLLSAPAGAPYEKGEVPLSHCEREECFLFPPPSDLPTYLLLTVAGDMHPEYVHQRGWSHQLIFLWWFEIRHI